MPVSVAHSWTSKAPWQLRARPRPLASARKKGLPRSPNRPCRSRPSLSIAQNRKENRHADGKCSDSRRLESIRRLEQQPQRTHNQEKELGQVLHMLDNIADDRMSDDCQYRPSTPTSRGSGPSECEALEQSLSSQLHQGLSCDALRTLGHDHLGVNFARLPSFMGIRGKQRPALRSTKRSQAPAIYTDSVHQLPKSDSGLSR
jgi:hypothetical protein